MKKRSLIIKKLIHHFNNASIVERFVYSYSRPVFDDSKKYAIIQWDLIPEGGGIDLYHLNDNGIWETSGNIVIWKY